MEEKNRQPDSPLAKQLRQDYQGLGQHRVNRINPSFESIELITEMYLRNMRHRSEDDFVERSLQRAAENKTYKVQGKYRHVGWTGDDFRYEYLRIVNRLCPYIFQGLRELLPFFGATFTTVSKEKRPFPGAGFKRSWRAAKRLAGIQGLNSYDLRRTAITGWIQQGQPKVLAGKVAGHSRLETTRKHYAAVDAEIVRGFTE